MPLPKRATDVHIPDLNLVQAGVLVLLQVDVDGEMGIDVSHLVLVSFGDTDDQVVDERSDRSQSSHIFPGTVVQLDVDDVLGRVGEGDGQMSKVLDQFACCNRVNWPHASKVGVAKD